MLAPRLERADARKDLGLARCVDLEAVEVGAIGRADVDEEARWVLVEMQIGAALQVEDPAALLPQHARGANAQKQRLERVERGGAGVLHGANTPPLPLNTFMPCSSAIAS